MRSLGNLLWFVFGGLLSGLMWWMVGIIYCCTIIGIPVGLQCFKMSALSFFPFKKDVAYTGGTFSFLVNVIWICIGGIELAAVNAMIGLIWCITIVGIPWGKQFFKIAKLCLMPFGAEIVNV